MQEIKNQIFSSISKLEDSLSIGLNTYSRDNILTFMVTYEKYKDLRPFISDIINKLHNIRNSFEHQIFLIMDLFVNSDETDIRKFIETKLYKENEDLLIKNQELQTRNYKLITTNKQMKKYKQNYNEDGSSKANIENDELKALNEKLIIENHKLKNELDNFKIVKYYIDQLNK